MPTMTTSNTIKNCKWIT